MKSPLAGLSLRRKLRRAIAIYNVSGWRGLKDQSRARLLKWLRDDETYQRWVRQYDTLNDSDRATIRQRIGQFALRPRISVVMPVYNVAEPWLRRAIDSVRAQLYPDWQLCIADDCSSMPHIRPLLESYARDDERIKVTFRQENGHISAASNSALELASGEFIVLLDHDDELTEDALCCLVEEIQRFPNADLLYSDEDMIDDKDRRFDPKFKPDWSPDLFYSLNLVTHMIVYRSELLRRLGGFRLGFEGSQDYDLALRAIEQIAAGHIRHIPRILYHWRSIPGSVAYGAEQKDYAHERARNAIREHLQRKGITAEVTEAPGNLHRVKYALPEPAPKISVLIMASPQPQQLQQSISKILQGTDYPSFEIGVIVPDSLASIEKELEALLAADRRVVLQRVHANSPAAAYNSAAEAASGSILCFLSNLTHEVSPDWLQELASHANRPGVGTVGALILKADGKVWHAGMILGIRGSVGYGYRKSDPGAIGHLMRLRVIQNLSAVSGSCMTIKREAFAAVRGFDSAQFPARFADVDLCLRLGERGLRTVWTPYAKVTQSHRPGQTEEFSNADANSREVQNLRNRWQSALADDPYYNPNLTLENESSSLASPPRLRY